MRAGPPNIIFVLTDDQGYPPIAHADWPMYEDGVALALSHARLEIEGVGTFDTEIAEKDESAEFRVRLGAGALHLRCWLTGGGTKQSPYYVDVRRIDP